jgi:hypothetical protein
MSSEDSTSSSTGRGWKFSLRTMLLVIAILCLAIPLILQSSKLNRAQVELRQLRDQLGYLTIDDRSKVHIIAVDVDEPNTWRWRMFLPRGVRYTWCLGYGDIPAQGVPKSKMDGISNESYSETDSEVVITAKLRQMDNRDWTLSVSSSIQGSQAQMGGASTIIPDKEMRWTREVPGREGHVLGSGGTETLDPKGPIVLLQWRSVEKRPDGTYGPSAKPMPGYMIWLHQQ